MGGWGEWVLRRMKGTLPLKEKGTNKRWAEKIKQVNYSCFSGLKIIHSMYK